MATEPGKEWVGTPLDADRIDPRGIVEIVVEFDEGEEILTPKLNERFGSYDLNEAARYIYLLSNHILKGSRLDGERQARLVGRHRGEEAGLGRPRGSEGQPGADPPHLRPLRGRPEGLLRPRGRGGVLLPGRRAQ